MEAIIEKELASELEKEKNNENNNKFENDYSKDEINEIFINEKISNENNEDILNKIDNLNENQIKNLEKTKKKNLKLYNELIGEYIFKSPLQKTSTNSHVYFKYGLAGLFQLPNEHILQL